MIPLDIYGAMTQVMSDVQNISKDQRVTEGPARFNFRGVDDVVNAVGPVLRKYNVVVVPHEVVSVEHERYTTRSGAPMDGVTIVIRWRFYASDGSFIEASSAGQSADSGDKAIPKAHSVAYRTVLLQALCIPTDEPDPDSSVHERADEFEPPLFIPAAPADIQKIRDARDLLGVEQAAEFVRRWRKHRFPAPENLSAEQGAVALADLMAITEKHDEAPA